MNVAAAISQDGRDEDLGDAVREAGDRRLRALRALDELDDPGQRRVAPDAGGAHDERAGRVDGRPDDLVAGTLDGRDRLAGQHRLVDRRRAVDDDTVDRDLVAGTDAQQVADDHGVERDVLLDRAAHDAGRLGLQRSEPPDGARRPDLRAGLEPATEQDEPDDDRGAVEVGGGLEARVLHERRRERQHDAVGPGGARADRHERVHVAVPWRAARHAAR